MHRSASTFGVTSRRFYCQSTSSSSSSSSSSDSTSAAQKKPWLYPDAPRLAQGNAHEAKRASKRTAPTDERTPTFRTLDGYMWRGPGATPALSGFPADWEKEAENPLGHSWEESGREQPTRNGAWRKARPPKDHLRWNGELPPALKQLIPEWELHMEQFYCNRETGFVAGAVPTRIWQHPGDASNGASPVPYCVRSGDPWFPVKRETVEGFEKRAQEYKAKWRDRTRAERATAIAKRAEAEAPINLELGQEDDLRMQAFYESRGWDSFEKYSDEDIEEFIGDEGIPGGYDLPLLQHMGFRPPEGGWEAVGRGEALPEVVNNGLRITYPDEPSDYQELHPPSLPLVDWLERWGRIMSDGDLLLAQSSVLEEDVRGMARDTGESSRVAAAAAAAAMAAGADDEEKQEEVVDIGGADDDEDDAEEEIFLLDDDEEEEEGEGEDDDDDDE